jgi:GNAT superfamily N-acetyltransferase
MNRPKKNIPLKMSRENLDNLPQFPLAPGSSLRWYQPGDEENWFRIHALADHHNEITSKLFQDEFGTNQQLLAKRQCYLLDPRGVAIGTGTAWFNDNFEGAKFGRVHWMAIVPEFQRRGLAKPLMTALCARLRELGHERAYLSTSSARLPAIKLYLQFGFVPMIRSEMDAVCWTRIIDRFGQTEH